MRESSEAYKRLMEIVAVMEAAAKSDRVAARVRGMYDLVNEIERGRIEAETRAGIYRSAAYGAEMDKQKREADAYAKGLADGYRECAQRFGEAIKYEPDV